MKAVLVGISSRYIHSVLACYYLKEYCPEFDIDVVELNVNMSEGELLDAVKNIKADFVGFSCYIFNIEVVKRLLSELIKMPDRPKIILGGPEVSFLNDEFLTLADYIVVGEGEVAFREILEGKATQKIVVGKKPDLKTLPTPYTDYMIENVVRTSKNNKILYFESSRGCPYKCSYCMSSLSGGVRFFDLNKTKEQLRYLYSCHPKQIKFVDRTFNVDINRAKEIIAFIIDLTRGDATTNFHFEMSAEIVDDELIEIMSRAAKGLIQIEIGVQSFNPAALAASDRSDDTEKLKQNLAKFMSLKNIHIHLDLIAGLPNDDFASFRDSVNLILGFDPDYLQIGFLKLLKGSKMRAEADTHQMTYQKHAPYEIISSKYFSENELEKIRRVADGVSRFYNKHRYDEELLAAAKSFDTCFDMYLKIGEMLAGGKYQKSRLDDMYRLLLELTT